MDPNKRSYSFKTGMFSIVVICLMQTGFPDPAWGQEEPPRPITVTTFQNLSFGAIVQGFSGGSVIVYPNGSRSVTGDIVQANLGYAYYPAIFEVSANLGTLVTILNGPDVILNGSNGGTLTLQLGESDPPSPYVNSTSPPGVTQVRIGGTLYVGSPLANPAGSYHGTFFITFIQE